MSDFLDSIRRTLFGGALDRLPEERRGVREGFGLEGAGVDRWRSPYEPTMAPGETRSNEELRDMLANVFLAAGSGAVPVVGPRGVEIARNAARVRPGGEAAFNRWFAGSKVTEPTGEPQTVYHGTPNAGFSTFDRLAPRELASKKDRMDSIGTWFAADRPGANMFSGDEGGGVYPAHLSLKNPKVYESFDALMSEWASVAKPPKGGPLGVAPRGPEQFRKHLMQQGHDGIVIRDQQGIDLDGPQTYYTAFEPTQIKSAIGNRGTYDPNDPRIDF